MSETTMSESTPAIREIPQRRSRAVYIVAAAIAVVAAIVHLGSYWFSPSLTLFDVTVTCDEGLVSANVPLTRLTPHAKPAFGFVVYTREQRIWTAGADGMTPLRSVMKMLDVLRCEGGMLADFGFWKGGWQKESRPGPFVVVFVPVFFVGLCSFGFYLLVHFGFIRFRLRSLFIVIALWAIVLWVLMLRAPATVVS